MNYYNNFYKLQFIESLSDKEKKQAKSIFKKSRQTEEGFDKDLYNFTDFEIETFLYSINTSSKNTLITYINFARKYVDYAIENGNRISNINLFKTFTYDKIDKYLQKYKNKYLSIDNFNLNIDTLYNPSDRALVLSIFHGIGGFQYNELSNLTINDVKDAKNNEVGILNDVKYFSINLTSVNENTDKITNRSIGIPKNLINELEKSYYENHYYLNNGESNSRIKAVSIIEGEHVFRNTLVRNITNEKIDKQIIYRRLKKLKDLTSDELGTITTVVNSGIIYYMYLFSKEGELEFANILKVAERFNIAINQSSPNSSLKNIMRKHEKALKSIYQVDIINVP